jgi:hypothetical protein
LFMMFMMWKNVGAWFIWQFEENEVGSCDLQDCFENHFVQGKWKCIWFSIIQEE